jgi:GT2 family glycosyltransferase
VTTSVIVVSYRPATWLEECLASVLPQADEVILVDNGSDGQEASAVARRLGATPVRSPVNLGFAGGVHLGLAHARGEVVGLLNDDATAEPGWLASAGAVLADTTVAAVTPKVLLTGRYREIVLDDEALMAPGDARPLGRQLFSVTVAGSEVLDSAVGGGLHDIEEGIVDGRPERWRWTSGRRAFYVPIVNGDGEIRINGEPVAPGAVCPIVNHAGSFLKRDGSAAEYGFGAPDDGRFDRPAERFGFSGTAPVFRSETLRRLGGLAPQFFAYNEDTDWCLRARLAGLRIAYDPGAVIRHRLSATSRGPKDPFVRYLAARNHLLCLVRNAPVDVARRLVWQRLTDHPAPGLRKAVLPKLPWALASRARMSRHWVSTPRAVWDRWAGADTTWDDGPCRVRDQA